MAYVNYSAHGQIRSAYVPGSRLTSRFWPLRRRSVIELAGLFIIVTIAAVWGVSMNNHTESNAASAGSSQHAVNLQMTHSSSTTPPAQSNSNVNPSTTGNSSSDQSNTSSVNSQSQTSSSTSVNTTVTSTDQNGNTSTTMTVNGQPVNVPANGSTSFTTPDGDNVSATHSSTQGGADNSSSETLNVNVTN